MGKPNCGITNYFLSKNMKKKKEPGEGKEKLLQLLSIQDADYDLILKKYNEQKEIYLEQLERAENIRVRIKLQNEMIDLDDAFFEYQSSMGG